MGSVVAVDLDRAARPLGVALRLAFVAVTLAALVVDLWVLRGYGARTSYVILVAIAAVGIAWAAWPRVALAMAVFAAVLSLLETVGASHSDPRFALFTEFVVLPVLFGAVLAQRSIARWPIALLVFVAAETMALRSEDGAIRAILAVSMLALLGAAVAAVVYMRLRDGERRTSIERARNNERLDLARELHDIVGYHVTGIVVLAQASRFTDGQPGSPTDRALAEIEAAGLETLRSMRRLVGLLRTDGSTSPAPRLPDIEQLVEDLRTTHPSTDLIIDDELIAHWVPPDLANTVHRLVQETATNVRRHGDPAGPVTFTMRSTDRTLDLTVENTMSHASIDKGYGVVGMRERVEALGGTFAAGPEGAGQWIVRASLPMSPSSSDLNGVGS